MRPLRLSVTLLGASVGCASSTTTAPEPPPLVSRGPATAPGASATPAPAPEPSEPPAPPPRDPGRANLDPADDALVGPPEAIPDCEARLTAAGVRFRAATLPVKGTCGAPQVVVYEAGPTEIKWNAAPVTTCALALGLARFERVLQEEAERHLSARVVRIQQGGTYSCRKMARFRMVSEHSFANAIDLHAFELSDRRRLTVKRDFGPLGAEPEAPGSRFLRAVARRAFAEDVFSVVLTPFWDQLHADHFHVDQARYRVGAVGPASAETADAGATR